jgi:ribosome biogenesis GTPase / thiamine phosphate phosphatase
VSGPISTLHDLGWRASFADALKGLADSGLVPGRIVLQQRGRFTVATETGEIAAALADELRTAAVSAAELPCVGDWVAVFPPAANAALGAISTLLPRITKLSRRAAGSEHVEQVLAANVDTIFIAMGLDGDFNLHRLERYLAVASDGGGRPVVVLTKADLCAGEAELAARVGAVEAIAPGVAVVATSVVGAAGVHALDPFLGRGQTIAMLGSSGAGKSSLVNALLQQELLRTGEVRPSDSQGRHTTTQRQLFCVLGGALVIDTPGISDLQLWAPEVKVRASFPDIEAAALHCRFRDCGHQREPGCAVIEAVARDQLPAERLASWNKLQLEQSSAANRADPGAARKRKRHTDR